MPFTKCKYDCSASKKRGFICKLFAKTLCLLRELNAFFGGIGFLAWNIFAWQCKGIVLLYYIYLGKLCPKLPGWWSLFDTLTSSHPAEPPSARARDRETVPGCGGDLRAPTWEQTRSINGQKVLISSGGNANEKQNFHKTALFGFGTVVSCE